MLRKNTPSTMPMVNAAMPRTLLTTDDLTPPAADADGDLDQAELGGGIRICWWGAG